RWILRVDEKAYRGPPGHELVKQLHLLCRNVAEQEAHAGDVVARPGEARDHGKLGRGTPHREHDRNRAGYHRLRLEPLAGAAGRDEHVDATSNQIARQPRYAIDLPFGKAIFDGDVLSLDKAHLSKPLAECGHDARGISRAALAEVPDHWCRRLLR